MDENNNQTTENVYTYGEPANQPESDVDINENVSPESYKESEEQKTAPEENTAQENKFAYQDNHYDYSQQYTQNRTTDQGAENAPMELKDWILTLIVLMIPCVGIVMYFVWAFGENVNINKRNFCRAQLIIFAVLLVIYLLFFAVFGAVAITNVALY